LAFRSRGLTVEKVTPSGLAPADPDVPRTTGAQQGVPAQAGPDDEVEPPGPLLAQGRASDVYALSEHQVLRRYRSGRDAGHDAEIMRHVAAHGFPVPQAEHAGGPDLLMERLHGPTLLQALAAGEVSLHDGARVLADLHARLHAIPARAGEVVVHLDLHPGNVIVSEQRGPVLIDWANARGGAAALDVAVTSLILAEVAVDAGGDYSRASRALLAAFLGDADEDPVPALDEAARMRREDPGLIPGECDLVEPAADLVRRFVALTSHR
jgi:Ser/Thr protein kinase RdoA (MazF antagonist)